MKQIKTIMVAIKESKDPKDFDNMVNELLAEGWTLVKRELIPAVDFGSAYQPHTLYSELEKEDIAKAGCNCESCKHRDLARSSEPCYVCFGANRWEPRKP